MSKHLNSDSLRRKRRFAGVLAVGLGGGALPAIVIHSFVKSQFSQFRYIRTFYRGNTVFYYDTNQVLFVLVGLACVAAAVAWSCHRKLVAREATAPSTPDERPYDELANRPPWFVWNSARTACLFLAAYPLLLGLSAFLTDIAVLFDPGVPPWFMAPSPYIPWPASEVLYAVTAILFVIAIPAFFAYVAMTIAAMVAPHDGLISRSIVVAIVTLPLWPAVVYFSPSLRQLVFD